MKTSAIFASGLTLFALIIAPITEVQAKDLETCFQSTASAVGKISMGPQEVKIHWDVDDFAEASQEAGKVSEYKTTNGVTSGVVTMNGAEGAGSLFIDISKTQIGLVELNSQKEPMAPKEFRQRVSCPKEASPLELASEEGLTL